ncbi:hypothetical protein EC846_0842 [Acinetobacter sp. BIGb0102]|uniref:hypothetical protein n=1 Tax=Acinetobacter sp. BIGb0102 TaxID=2485131 RepID=UPI000F4E55C7|nr:hypothetical protein [Acinetobacter sp. BIGb0102]RPE31379.1 hypothetical protein EC846_0842 [Acinetobacter sp. BIGb0102]
MHDWSFISINIIGVEAKIVIQLRNNKSEDVFLIAENFLNFKLTKKDEWGESISLNEITRFDRMDNGNFYIKLEIQSGDVCEIEAKNVILPTFFDTIL